MGLTAKISRKKLDEHVSKYGGNSKTLEVGAYGKPSYSRFFTNKIGLDVREGPGVDVVASVYELPFEDNTFETVLCMVVMEHLEYPPQAIAEMKRVLKPGGRIIVSVPFLFPIHDSPGDYWRFTKYGLQLLFKDWEIEVLQAETTMNETFAVLLQRVGYQSQFYANSFMKVLIFGLAWILSRMPTMTKHVYGDLTKTYKEPEAFTSSFFLVAKKRD